MDKNIREIIFILTTKCNHKCSFCCEPKSQNDFTLLYAKYCIDKISKNNIEWIDLSGGEPLLNNDVIAIADYAKSNKLKVTLSSNGLLLRDFYSELKYNINQWNVSLHGQEAIHDRLANRKGSYEKVIDTCEFLISKNKTVHVTYVVSKDNISDIKPTVEILKKIGIQKICFNYIFRRGNGLDYMTDNKYSFKDLIDRTNKITEQIDNVLIYHNMNLDGQCLLLRNNGAIWAVPFSNENDYLEISNIENIENIVSNYRFIENHLSFQKTRLLKLDYEV